MAATKLINYKAVKDFLKGNLGHPSESHVEVLAIIKTPAFFGDPMLNYRDIIIFDGTQWKDREGHWITDDKVLKWWDLRDFES